MEAKDPTVVVVDDPEAEAALRAARDAGDVPRIVLSVPPVARGAIPADSTEAILAAARDGRSSFRDSTGRKWKRRKDFTDATPIAEVFQHAQSLAELEPALLEALSMKGPSAATKTKWRRLAEERRTQLRRESLQLRR